MAGFCAAAACLAAILTMLSRMTRAFWNGRCWTADEPVRSQEAAMEFEHGAYCIDPTPPAEGGRYYARAKIFTREAHTEIKWSGDLGECGSEAEAAARGRNWAVDWCERHRAGQ
jgi:hypothetical protein